MTDPSMILSIGLDMLIAYSVSLLAWGITLLAGVALCFVRRGPGLVMVGAAVVMLLTYALDMFASVGLNASYDILPYEAVSWIYLGKGAIRTLLQLVCWAGLGAAVVMARDPDDLEVLEAQMRAEGGEA